MKLELKNRIPIEFAENGHTYKMGERLVPGATQVIGVLNKPFLVPWSAKMVWAELTGKFQDVVKGTEDEYEKRILLAKGAASRRSKGARDSGTLAHDWIENYIGAKVEGKPHEEKLDDPEAQNAVNQFLEWEKAHKVEYLASELVLGSEAHLFGGKIDCVAIVDDEVNVLDWKTSSMISNEMFLQLAGYSILLEENGATPMPIKRRVVRLPKDGEHFEQEIRGIDLYDNEIFIHCREVERWLGVKNTK